MTVPPVPSDSLRAALDSVFASGAYDWRGADMTVSWIQRQWLALIGWLSHLRAVDPWLYRLLVALLVAVLLAILLHAAMVLYRTVRQAGPVDDNAVPVPVTVRDAAWYRAEADRLARDGQYVAAMQAAFMALARQLDAAGMLQYDSSRTPAECARDARLAEQDRPRLRRLVGELYLAAFGGLPVTADDVARWRRDAETPWHAPAH